MAEASGNGGQGKPRFEVHFIKSQYFRVVHADGAWGGMTNAGFINMTLYSERPAIPQRIVHELAPLDNARFRLGGELERIGKEGVIRELEVSVMLTKEAATALVEWLGKQLLEAERREK